MPNYSFSSLLFIFHILYHNEEIMGREHILELSTFCLLMSYVSPTISIHLETSIIPRFVTGSKLPARVKRSKHRKLWGVGRERITVSKPQAPIKNFFTGLKPSAQKTHKVTHSFIKINHTILPSNKCYNTGKNLTVSFPRETPRGTTVFHVVYHTMTFP